MEQSQKNIGWLSVRRREAEWMDAPDADAVQLQKSLIFIRRINTLLGYNRTTLGHLKKFSRQWKPGERITILDVATGSGDMPAVILKWTKRRGFDVRIVGVDLHEQTVRAAAAECIDSNLRLVRADATLLPFADKSFDYVLTSMFLHHLDEPAAIEVLGEMRRVAKRGMMVADLLRSRRAYAWIWLFTLFANPMVRHDAPVSVAQAFNRAEVLRLRELAGLGFLRFFRHFGHRFVLAGEVEGGMQSAECRVKSEECRVKSEEMRLPRLFAFSFAVV